MSLCTALQSNENQNLTQGDSGQYITGTTVLNIELTDQLTGMFKNSVKSVLRFLQQDHPCSIHRPAQIVVSCVQTYLHCIMEHRNARMVDTGIY